MFKIYRTKEFEIGIRKLFSKEEQKQVENFEKKQLINNPYVGDPLSYSFFREKKVNGKRVYYLIYESFKVVLMAAVSNKKRQQETIDKITEGLEQYSARMSLLMQRGESGRA